LRPVTAAEEQDGPPQVRHRLRHRVDRLHPHMQSPPAHPYVGFDAVWISNTVLLWMRAVRPHRMVPCPPGGQCFQIA
jgi:hypothetical protein